MLAPVIARRLLFTVPTIIGVVTIVFLILRLLPGDPAELLAGEFASPDVVESIRRQLGLDKPLHIQYILYLERIARLDLGFSFRTNAPVSKEILARLPNTITLTLAAMLISVAAGIAAGVVSSVRQYSKVDYSVMTASVFGVSMPTFWQGLMLILVFGVYLRLLPAGGIGTPAHVILPAVTLGTSAMALVARMTRSSMLEVLRQDYVRTARAKGLIERIVIYKHSLKNALIPVVTIVGLQFGGLLGGAVLTETVFAWPGVGRLLVESILARDYAMVQGTILVFSLMFIIVNLLTDIVYAIIDPRIRYD